MIGHIIFPSTPVASKTININKPKGSSREYFCAQLTGSIADKTRPPSRGNNGNKFNTINTIFIKIPAPHIDSKNCELEVAAEIKITSFAKMPHIIIMIKLAAGPAKATNAISRLGFRKFFQVTGTGFAQPKIKLPINKSINGKTTVPMGSMCFIGFSVIRPMDFAV